MSPAAAIADNTVLAYIALAAALLSGSGGLLLFLAYGLERPVGSIWRIYRGWLVMVPVILCVLLAGLYQLTTVLLLRHGSYTALAVTRASQGLIFCALAASRSAGLIWAQAVSYVAGLYALRATIKRPPKDEPRIVAGANVDELAGPRAAGEARRVKRLQPLPGKDLPTIDELRRDDPHRHARGDRPWSDQLEA